MHSLLQLGQQLLTERGRIAKVSAATLLANYPFFANMTGNFGKGDINKTS